jgi:hypothetical protein
LKEKKKNAGKAFRVWDRMGERWDKKCLKAMLKEGSLYHNILYADYNINWVWFTIASNIQRERERKPCDTFREHTPDSSFHPHTTVGTSCCSIRSDRGVKLVLILHILLDMLISSGKK